MFDACPHFTLLPIRFPILVIERGVAARPALNAPAHPLSFVSLSLLLVDIGPIAIKHLLLAMQQIRQVFRIMHLRRGHGGGMGHPLRICADVQFHPETIRTLARTAHFRVHGFFLVLQRARRADYRGVYNRALAQQQLLGFQMRRYFRKQLFGQTMPLQQVAKLQNRSFIRYLVLASSMPTKRRIDSMS